MKLAENFTIEELTTTRTGIDNRASVEAVVKLFYLAQFILQPIRNEWGRLRVTSGYRCPELNRHVGSRDTSQHPRGEAADIQTIDADIGVVFDWLVNESGIVFGQAILEKKGPSEWIHISMPRMGGKQNQQALEITDGVRKPYKV